VLWGLLSWRLPTILLPCATTAKHLHVTAYNFCHITSLAAFILPLPSADLTFHINLLATPDVLTDNTRQTSKKDNTMPFCALFFLARGLISPRLISSNTEQSNLYPRLS